NLFAKALFQTANLLRLYWPFREQVRSYVRAWERAFVGANLFAKALFSTPNLLRLYGPFREQVRSYVWVWEPDGFCRSELVREGFVFNAKSSATVRALSRTSSLLRLGMGAQTHSIDPVAVTRNKNAPIISGRFSLPGSLTQLSTS
ncbi:hypothetical protein, partial [Pseudomonas syringae]|uniref:hypothetical protein n=1 Tax=Pseudomonas syringae TaxID=317 RepID=UPI0019562F6D